MLAPQIIPSSALGRDGAVAPSERLVMGGIGIGNRGTYDLGCFLEQKDVQFVAVCDVKATRREAVKKIADQQSRQQRLRHVSAISASFSIEIDIDAVLIATGPNWHCTAAMAAARAGKDMYCEKPCTKNIAQSLTLADTIHRTGVIFQAGTQRRNLPHFAFACELARTGKLGKLKRVYAHPAGMTALMSGWLPAEPEPPKEVVDWNMYLGPAAWRPYNGKLLDGFNFEKGGGLVGGGVLEWGSHCVDLCQWANNADGTAPIEYNPPKDGQLVARYANGVELILREKGWMPLGSCPVRFEGETGWVEAGDSGKTRAEFARAAGRAQGRRDRWLPGHFPRARLPRLCKNAQPAEGQCRRGLLLAYRLPRGQHRARAESQAQLRLQEAGVHRRRTGQPAAVRSAARTLAHLVPPTVWVALSPPRSLNSWNQSHDNFHSVFLASDHIGGCSDCAVRISCHICR